MGAGSSSNPIYNNIEQQSKELLTKFTHFISDAVVEDSNIESSKECWKMVTDDLSPLFLTLRSQKDESIPSSCLTWFYDSFYKLLHEFDTDSKALYNDSMRVQVRALVAMISTSLSIFKNSSLDKITKSLKELSQKHYQRGVRAYQFPIFGEVLMKTFAFCLGEAWTDAAKEGWSKIFSVMLSIIVPTSLKIERDCKTSESSTTVKGKTTRSVGSATPDTASNGSEITSSISSENIAIAVTNKDLEINTKINEVTNTLSVVNTNGESVPNESNTFKTTENALE
eukprot:gene20306-26357_t